MFRSIFTMNVWAKKFWLRKFQNEIDPGNTHRPKKPRTRAGAQKLEKIIKKSCQTLLHDWDPSETDFWSEKLLRNLELRVVSRRASPFFWVPRKLTILRSGILLPDSAKSKIPQGTVLAVGPGELNMEGNRVPVSIKVDSEVFLPEYGGTKVPVENDEVFLYREDEILAVIE